MPTPGKNIRLMADGRYRVRYKLGLKERRKLCKSEAEAKHFLERERQRILAKGRAALAMTQKQDARVMIMIDAMSDGKGLEYGLRRLEKAAKWYPQHAASLEIPSVSEAVEDLIQDWRNSKRNAVYISNAGGILRRFAVDHPKSISAVKPRDVHNWLNSLELKDRKTPKARVSKLFAHAVLNSWIESNFVVSMRIEPRKREVIEVPSFKEIEAALEDIMGSEEYRPLLPSYTRRLYGGPRTIESLDPRVREENGFLIVPSGAAAKRGPARQLRVSDAFVAWAEWCQGNELPSLTSQEFKKLDLAYRESRGHKGVRKWHNWQRHAYASYRLPLLGDDLAQLAKEMGNSPQVLLNNYLGNVAATDVPLFWAFRPHDRNAST